MEDAAAVQRRLALDGRVAVVTGAGSGIGRTSAEVLAGAGATVWCVDVDGARAEETVAAIGAAGGEALRAVLDVTDRAALGRLFDDVVAARGRVDVLANIAGVASVATILDLDEREFDRVLAVNLKGVLFGCQAAGAVMVAQGGGSIINIASAAVLVPSPRVGAYAMTKSAVWQLTRTMAVEVGKRGVRVNAIAPGFIPTNMTAPSYQRPDGSLDEELKAAVLEPMVRSTPLRRPGETADIAYCVFYLASDASSFMTGQLLSPNGGIAMH